MKDGIFCIEKKDYEITLDTGKKLLITGEKVVGVFGLDDEHYFEGAIFSKMPRGYVFDGSLILNKKEFDEQVKSVSEIG